MMKLDKNLREYELHKVKNYFDQRLNAITWKSNENGQLIIARLNGAISASRSFMKDMGLEAEFKDLEDYYDPDMWEQVYDPEIANWRMQRKAVHE